jgi:hypothetical protein
MECSVMSNLLEQAICADDGDRAAKIIQRALGIASDDVRPLLLPEASGGGERSASPGEMAERHVPPPSKFWKTQRLLGNVTENFRCSVLVT